MLDRRLPSRAPRHGRHYPHRTKCLGVADRQDILRPRQCQWAIRAVHQAACQASQEVPATLARCLVMGVGLPLFLERYRAILVCLVGRRGFLECLRQGMVMQACPLQAMASKDRWGSQGHQDHRGRLAIRDSQECFQELNRGLAVPACNPERANWERPSIRECLRLHSKGWVCRSTPELG